MVADMRSKRMVRPIESLNPDEEKIRPTLVKICSYIEWIMQELNELREEIEAKPNLSEHNNLSLQIDAMDRTVGDLANKLDELE